MLTVSSASAEREIALPARRAAEAKRAAIARYSSSSSHYYYSCSIGWCPLLSAHPSSLPGAGNRTSPEVLTRGLKAEAGLRRGAAEPRGSPAEPRGGERGGRPRTAGSAGGNAVGFFTGSFSQRRILLHA